MFGYPENGKPTSIQIISRRRLLNFSYRDILGRRKEVLFEIFYFTKHPDVPPDSESILEQAVAESTDLKEFLTLNDLER